MAKNKKKARKFDVVAAVKAAAREKVGTPKPTRAEPARRGREKHKPTLGELLTDD